VALVPMLNTLHRQCVLYALYYNATSHLCSLKAVVEEIVHMLHIQEVLISNLGPETGCRD
jgi:hypothetical protein